MQVETAKTQREKKHIVAPKRKDMREQYTVIPVCDEPRPTRQTTMIAHHPWKVTVTHNRVFHARDDPGKMKQQYAEQKLGAKRNEMERKRTRGEKNKNKE